MYSLGQTRVWACMWEGTAFTALSQELSTLFFETGFLSHWLGAHYCSLGAVISPPKGWVMTSAITLDLFIVGTRDLRWPSCLCSKHLPNTLSLWWPGTLLQSIITLYGVYGWIRCGFLLKALEGIQTGVKLYRWWISMSHVVPQHPTWRSLLKIPRGSTYPLCIEEWRCPTCFPSCAGKHQSIFL